MNYIRHLKQDGVNRTAANKEPDKRNSHKDKWPYVHHTKEKHPVGVALDDHGNLFVTDYGNSRIRKIKLR